MWANRIADFLNTPVAVGTKSKDSGLELGFCSVRDDRPDGGVLRIDFQESAIVEASDGHIRDKGWSAV
jgi:hypothetical protein